VIDVLYSLHSTHSHQSDVKKYIHTCDSANVDYAACWLPLPMGPMVIVASLCPHRDCQPSATTVLAAASLQIFHMSARIDEGVDAAE